MHVPSSVFYRRTLPHIVRYDRPLFITWSTYKRWILPPGARTIALRHLLFEHLLRIWVDVAVIMPDHVHMILSLLETRQFDDRVLSRIMKSIKGISARNINLLLKRRGPVWRDESFDHVVRKTETSRAKFELSATTRSAQDSSRRPMIIHGCGGPGLKARRQECLRHRTSIRSRAAVRRAIRATAPRSKL
jgi:REP element-mobilizing transposase RayT